MQSPAVACREIEPPSSSAVPVAEKLFSPCRHWLVELEDRPPRRVWRGKGAQLADQRALGHFLQAQRGDDLVDVGLLVDDRLPVDLADRADQALRVPRGIVVDHLAFSAELADYKGEDTKRNLKHVSAPGDCAKSKW